MTTLAKWIWAGAAVLMATPAIALNINLIDTSVTEPEDTLLNALMAADSGVTVVPGSVTFIGRIGDGYLAQSATYSDFNLAPSGGGPTIRIEDGILLTTGIADMAPSNTTSRWDHEAVDVSRPGTGRNDLLSVLSGRDTFDQNVLQFQFTLDDPDHNAVRIEIVFGSDEYPTQLETDVFGFFVDGENFAMFEDGSLIANNSATAFLDNPVNSGRYPIEYNGITRVLTITGQVNPEVSPHTAVIAIADTNDTIYDSGVFVANFRSTDGDDGGIDPPPPPGPGQAPVAVPTINVGGTLLMILLLLAFGLMVARTRG